MTKLDSHSEFEALLRDAAETPAVVPRATGLGRTLLGGRFVLEQRLGEGGMGVVYEAFDEKTQSRVALKVLSRVDAAGVYRFKKEFRSLAGVVHENLVALHELFADDGAWFFTMDLVRGVPFSEWVRPDAALALQPTEAVVDEAASRATTLQAPVAAAPSTPTGTRVDIVRLRSALAQLAAGIAAIHDAGKLHRDLKPSNVLVTSDGRVVILDFGLVGDATDGDVTQTIDRAIAGTPAYMAPEQARAERATAASDWYALGVMMYEALTGVLPFSGSVPEILVAKQNSVPPSPADVARNVPADLAALALKLLEPDAAKRPTGPEALERLRLKGLPADLRTDSVSPTSDNVPFVGRENELRVLGSCLARVADGRPVIALVHGLAGMGKTTLVERFVDRAARDARALVLRGRCYEREFVPFKAMDAAVDALSRHLGSLDAGDALSLLPRDIQALASIFPVLARVPAVARARGRPPVADPQEQRRRAFGALKELLARLADRSRLVLFIDDLQWGDEDGARLLVELLKPPEAPGMLFIGAYRRDEAERSPFLTELLRPEIRERLPEPVEVSVGPLGVAEAQRLAEELLGSRSSAESLAAIRREAAGNPYFISELVLHATRNAAARSALTLEQLLAERVAQLSQDARHLLEACVVAGRPLDVRIAASAASVDNPTAALAALRAAKLLRASASASEADRVEPLHDRVRETIVRSIDAERARMWHARLAAAMEAVSEPELDALARHHAAAGDQARAFGYAISAAERATEQLAFNRAADLYRLALDLSVVTGKERVALERKLADALAMAGRSKDAADAYLNAARFADTATARVLRRLAAEQLLMSGHLEQGLDLLRDDLARLGWRMPNSPSDALAAIWELSTELKRRGFEFEPRAENEVPPELLERVDTGWAATLGHSGTDTDLSMMCGLRNIIDALSAGEPRRITRALAIFVINAEHSTPGRPAIARASATAERAAALAADPYSRAWLCFARAWLQLDARATLEGLDQAVRLLTERCPGRVIEAGIVASWRMSMLVLCADVRAGSEFDLLVNEAAMRGDRKLAAHCRLLGGTLVWLARDDPEGALEDLKRGLELWSRPQLDILRFMARYYRLCVELYRASPLALNLATKLVDDFLPTMLATVASFRRHAFSAQGMAALADRGLDHAERARLVERAAHECQESRFMMGTTEAAILRAGLHALDGERDQAVGCLQEALATSEAKGYRMYTLPIRYRLGELIGGDEGAALRSAAEADMRASGVRNPARWARVLLPEMSRNG